MQMLGRFIEAWQTLISFHNLATGALSVRDVDVKIRD